MVPCWIAKLGVYAYATYGALVRFERGGGCFPGQEAIATATGISKRRVIEALADLEKAEAITVDRAPRGSRKTNTYHLRGHVRSAGDALVDAPGGQDVRSSGVQEAHSNQIEGLSSQTEGPNGPSESVRDSGIGRDEPGAHPDADRICELLSDHVADVLDHPGPPISKAWRREARLMLDGPGPKPPEWSREQLEFAITWLAGPTRDAQFWRGNVLSMDALRRQMPRIRSAIKREKEAKAQGRQTPTQSFDDLREMHARFAAQEAS